MILTDGQCHYAFVVETEPGAQERVVANLNLHDTRCPAGQVWMIDQGGTHGIGLDIV